MSHILLIEPNTLLADIYTQAFTYSGHTTTRVTDAQAAIFAADSRRPDVVILELLLPSHNGIEFLHEFRSYPDWQHTPVIVHTALIPTKTVVVAEALARDLGVRRLLYKPQTSLPALLSAIHEATDIV